MDCRPEAGIIKGSGSLTATIHPRPVNSHLTLNGLRPTVTEVSTRTLSKCSHS